MKVQEFINWMKAIAILIFIILAFFVGDRAFSWTMEMDYIGPGSEYEKLSKEIQDMKNEQSHERVHEGSNDPRDLRDAWQYEIDHGV